MDTAPLLSDLPRTQRGGARKAAVLVAASIFALACVVVAVAILSEVDSPVSDEQDDALKHELHLYTESEYQTLFEHFKQRHRKHYHSDLERRKRYLIFKRNVDLIRAHNEGNYAYTLGVNQFADLTREEFRARFLGLSPFPYPLQPATNDTVDVGALPASVDWREKRAVTAVKDQQQCGSCWAFSTTGSIEGVHALKTGHLVSLSEQQLVDCSQSAGNHGCAGGLMSNAFNYVQKVGLVTEDQYPYTARNQPCQLAKHFQPAATITGFQAVAANSEAALMAAVAQHPVSVAIEADQHGFQFYQSGVFDGPCGTQLDHGVLAVGYGTENGKDYWLIKNSWGELWGDAGYIKLTRTSSTGKPGQCGVAMMGSFPTM